MQYQVDPTRLLILLVLLASGMFVATRLVRPAPPSSPTALAPRRTAKRGMLAMTLLGLASGLAGGLAEDAAGDSTSVGALHAVYSVCWAPAFVTSRLRVLISGSGASINLARELLGLLGLALVPIFWFVVFLGVGSWLARRRARFSAPSSRRRRGS